VNRRCRPRGLYLGLALLTFCAVFATTAGARETLASRTQAVRATVAADTPASRTITVSAAWDDVQRVLSYDNGAQALTSIPPATIDAISSSLRADFNRAPVSLTPAGTDWSSITTGFNPVNGELPGTGGTPVRIEVTERQPFGQQVRLLSGRFPVATHAHAPATETLQVVMTRQTAATLGLHAGSTFVMPGSELASTGAVTAITVVVTGIVVPVDPASSFWAVDPGVLAADLQGPGRGPVLGRRGAGRAGGGRRAAVVPGRA
jgi:putative ABC transport system permease protein